MYGQDGGHFESETGTSWELTGIAAATTFVYHLSETSAGVRCPDPWEGGSTHLGKVALPLLGTVLGKPLAPTLKS